MKVYVVTRGVYSDYGIVGVTLDKEIAEKFVDVYNNADAYDDARVETYDTDVLSDASKWGNKFFVCYGVWGEILDVCEEGAHWVDFETLGEIFRMNTSGKHDFYITVSADTKERAVKIASEKMTRYMYEHNITAR